MNAVEIEQAISDLAAQPFDRAEFPFAFLEAFGNKATTIKKLRSGASNASDVSGGVLQRSNIHIATSDSGTVDATLKALRDSPKTLAAKAKFILATDGDQFQAEDLASGETVSCAYAEFPDHFGVFLPLAGITTVKQIRESTFDIRATSRLNKLYVELLKDNPDWASAERRPDMNHFMARLIFCFFAEDTDIFHGEGLFTKTVEQIIPVLAPEDEAKFETVTYTYYEQLNGYEHLKVLDIGYSFYTGPYTDKISALLDPKVKTIVHIPSVNSRESLKDKHREAEDIMQHLGEWEGVDPVTGFHLIRTIDGDVIRVADLVDDDPVKRDRVVTALKSPQGRADKEFVDVIIALGMAKEGFDWIWCEHALTVGYRSSLTEIIQIIGRATRDAPGKTRARFTNLIAEPAADDPQVVEAINDYLKAIAASLLMEQVLAPRFDFTPKDAGPKEGFDYGPDGYVEGKTNFGVNDHGQMHFEIKGLKLPKSIEATRICREDLNEVIAAFVQDKSNVERGMFDPEVVPEELTQLRMGKIVRDKYPELNDEDQESVRQHAIAAMTVTQQAKAALMGDGEELSASTAFIDGVRKFALSVTDLDIDLIDKINPFSATYAVLAKAMDEKTLLQVQAVINAKKVNLSYDEARGLAERALEFKRERGRLPSLTSQDAWERRMAEGVAYLQRHASKAAADG